MGHTQRQMPAHSAHSEEEWGAWLDTPDDIALPPHALNHHVSLFHRSEKVAVTMMPFGPETFHYCTLGCQGQYVLGVIEAHQTPYLSHNGAQNDLCFEPKGEQIVPENNLVNRWPWRVPPASGHIWTMDLLCANPSHPIQGNAVLGSSCH